MFLKVAKTVSKLYFDTFFACLKLSSFFMIFLVQVFQVINWSVRCLNEGRWSTLLALKIFDRQTLPGKSQQANS